jgi:predicted DNA-binding transcriptional regulator AlpA
MKMNVPKLLGHKEVTEYLGWSKQLLNHYIKKGNFPPPIQVLASTPLWTEEQIQKYKEQKSNLNIGD